MKIVHVVNQCYTVSNGIGTVIKNLIPEQEKLNHSVYLFNLYSNSTSEFNNDIYIPNNKEFRKRISDVKPDVVVFHGNYELKYYQFAYSLVKFRIPYFIVPHGGTSKYNLKKKRFLKTIVNFLFTQRFISNASGLFFLNKNERDNSIFLDKIKNVFIVPNGINLIEFDHSIKTKDKIVHFIFLSRIDIKNKGLDILLKAVENLQHHHPDVNFDFHFYGGRYSPTIIETFKIMIKDTDANVFYHGEVIGQEKDEAYKNANIYVLPSLSEGMPLTVLEALSYGCPCLISLQTNMGELINKNNAGWITLLDVESIESTLYKAYQDYQSDRVGYTERSINAVKPYNWSDIAKISIECYNKADRHEQ